eukprot:EG_transcript_19557
MATPSTVYLIDVLVLKRAAFGQGMKELLEDPEFPKVMFDCRQDSDALFHQYGVRLCGVWDLQIVELSLRLCKGERAGDLGPVLYWKQGVQRLRGLMDCMRRYGAGDLVDHKHPVHDQMRKESSFWLQRPLPPEMVRYAVGDVAGLLPIDAHFLTQLTEPFLQQQCQERSQRYTDHFRGKAHRTYDEYESNAYLPFGILRPFEQNVPIQACWGCKQMMPWSPRYFEFQDHKPGGAWCFVCKEVHRAFLRLLAARWLTVALQRATDAGGGGDAGPLDGILLCRGCTHCGEDGHKRISCPYREITCHRCGQPGHVATRCPAKVEQA